MSLQNLLNARDTTLKRLRVQPIDQRNDDDLFTNPLYPALMLPRAITFVGIYSATVSTALTSLAAGASANLYLDGIPKGIANGTYVVIPLGSLSGLVVNQPLAYSVGQAKLFVSLTNATNASVTIAQGTSLSFLVIRIDTNEV